MQAVVCEKDVRFQEQIQKHEEELMRVTLQSQNDGQLQQVQDQDELGQNVLSPCILYHHQNEQRLWLCLCSYPRDKLKNVSVSEAVEEEITVTIHKCFHVLNLLLLFCLSQALQAAQRRCEELEEAFKSRSQVLEVLQEEVNSADQQKQVQILSDQMPSEQLLILFFLLTYLQTLC